MNDEEKSKVKPTLKANAASFTYAKIRAIVEQITSQTAFGRFTLPSIDPFKLIEDF